LFLDFVTIRYVDIKVLPACSQRVLACRRQLVAFDQRDRSGSRLSLAAGAAPTGPGRCYGCAAAATEHCLTLLRALAWTPVSRQLLCAQGLVAELLDNNLRRGTVQVRHVIGTMALSGSFW
jgi:E3 ubiquitin-protein ligase UBR4